MPIPGHGSPPLAAVVRAPARTSPMPQNPLKSFILGPRNEQGENPVPRVGSRRIRADDTAGQPFLLDHQHVCAVDACKCGWRALLVDRGIHHKLEWRRRLRQLDDRCFRSRARLAEPARCGIAGLWCVRPPAPQELGYVKNTDTGCGAPSGRPFRFNSLSAGAALARRSCRRMRRPSRAAFRESRGHRPGGRRGRALPPDDTECWGPPARPGLPPSDG